MDIARQYSNNKLNEGLVVFAESQTKARGRIGRSWVSKENENITFSILLYPDSKMINQLTIASSVIISQYLETINLSPEIKWPNDVLINQKKIAGILVESHFQEGSETSAIVGIGLNVNDYPQIELTNGKITTSISNEIGHTIDRTQILVALLKSFNDIYISNIRWDQIFTYWKKHLITIGRKVTITTNNNIEISGIAESVDNNGALVVRKQNGEIEHINYGEIV